MIRLLLERRGRVRDVRRRALRRHADRRRTPSPWASTTSRCAWAPAGRPCSPMPNGLARGVRQASDFLMALQLTGAAKTESIANLQVRAAGRGDRRRPDRDRHRDRIARLLPGAGREVPARATRTLVARARRGRGVAQLWTARRARDRRRVPRACRAHPRRARGRGDAKAATPRHRRAAQWLGRRRPSPIAAG